MVLGNPYLCVLRSVHSSYSSQPPLQGKRRRRRRRRKCSFPACHKPRLGKGLPGGWVSVPHLIMGQSNLPFIWKHVSKGGHCAHVSPPQHVSGSCCLERGTRAVFHNGGVADPVEVGERSKEWE